MMCIKSLFGTNIKPLSISAARAFVKRRNVITHRNFSRDGNTSWLERIVRAAAAARVPW
jgi:hypothetical protein